MDKDNIIKNNQIKFKNKMINKKFEFMKLFTFCTFIVMVLHLISTIIFKILCDNDILPTLTAMIPVYVGVFTGYTVKSGVENHTKIKMNSYNSDNNNEFDINDDGEIQ